MNNTVHYLNNQTQNLDKTITAITGGKATSNFTQWIPKNFDNEVVDIELIYKEFDVVRERVKDDRFLTYMVYLTEIHYVMDYMTSLGEDSVQYQENKVRIEKLCVYYDMLSGASFINGTIM